MPTPHQPESQHNFARTEDGLSAHFYGEGENILAITVSDRRLADYLYEKHRERATDVADARAKAKAWFEAQQNISTLPAASTA